MAAGRRSRQSLNVWCPLFMTAASLSGVDLGGWPSLATAMRTVGGLEPDFLHVHQKEPVAIFEKAKAGPDHARVDQYSPCLVVQCR
jgi:hypothetical protein